MSGWVLESPDGPQVEIPFLLRAMAGPDVVDVVRVENAQHDGEAGAWRLGGAGGLLHAEASWRPAREAGRWEVTVHVAVLPDVEPFDAGLQIALRSPLAGDPGWLIPGLFYGENRPAASRSRFPRFAEPAPADPFAALDWSFRSDRMATPVAIASVRGGTLALAAEASSPNGQVGLGVGRLDASTIELRLAVPYRETPVVYDGGDAPLPADCPTVRWTPGESVEISYRVFAVAGSVARADAERAIVRSCVTRLAASSEARPAPLARSELESVADLAADGLLDWHDRPAEHALYETIDFDRPAGGGDAAGDRPAMHVAWLSGAPAATALLAHGRRTGRTAATETGRRVLDAIAGHRAPCGTFWGQWTREHGWTKGWTPGADILHGRTLAEATSFLIRALAIEPGHETWRAAVAANLDFVRTRQGPDGRLPTAWNGRTGEVASWAGSSALAWVPALAEGADLLGRADLLDVARAAGSAYATDLETGALRGAPEDVDLGPTSEDGYVAVMATVALAMRAGTAEDRAAWVRLAGRAADWMLTFRYSHDVPFAPHSTLGRSGIRTRGLDQASPANQHLHVYGLVCLPEMVRLARLDGDSWWLDRTRELLAASLPLIAREDGAFGRRGMLAERFFQTRYGGPIGEIGRLSHAWCLGLLLWACEAGLDLPELLDAPTS
jgi:hypothetical protein